MVDCSTTPHCNTLNMAAVVCSRRLHHLRHAIECLSMKNAQGPSAISSSSPAAASIEYSKHSVACQFVSQLKSTCSVHECIIMVEEPVNQHPATCAVALTQCTAVPSCCIQGMQHCRACSGPCFSAKHCMIVGRRILRVGSFNRACH